MNPPTVSSRSRSKSQNEPGETAFREITSRINVVSKSAKDPLAGTKKIEPDQKFKGPSKMPVAQRRCSIASRFAGPKADNCPAVTNLSQSKPPINKRASLQGVISEPLIRNSSNLSATPFCKTTAPSSKFPLRATTVSSVSGKTPGVLDRRQSTASQHINKPHKASTDVFKRSALPGCGKTNLTHPSLNKERGMLLKSASYWIEQIKLAEMIENYGVSIGFFRLAVECGAEPLEHLREELIAFIERYSLWSDTFQQLLLCYGVTAHEQESLLSRIEASGPKQTPLSSSGAMQSGQGKAPVETECADKARQIETKSSAQDLSNELEKELAKVSGREEVQVSISDVMLAGTGRIEDIDSESIKDMDAESITREVVSCIMSSMEDQDGNKDPLRPIKDEQSATSSQQKKNPTVTSGAAVNSDGSSAESISEPNSAHPEEATSSESLPSLNVWNTVSKDSDTCGAAKQEELALSFENVINDSTSTSKVTGEEICVSMDLVDALSDELESSKPIQEESKLNVPQPPGEVNGNVFESLILTANRDETTPLGKACSTVLNKDQNKASGKVSGCETRMGSSTNKASSKVVKVESPAVLSVTKPKFQRERRASQGFDRRHQKANSTPDSEILAENLASSTDNVVNMATLRRLSVSTSKLSATNSSTPTTTSKSQCASGLVQQPTEQVAGNQQRQSINPIQEFDNLVATPQHERKKLQNGDGSKQELPSIISDRTQTPDNNGLLATPGSAGLRRSTRLIKTAGLSTTGSVSTPRLQSVSTPRLQRCLKTPT